MNDPIVSVFMPVYNTAKFLAEAIESILNQSFENFEFIIIDDGSTDSSLEIIHEYARLDKRIKFLTRENRGIIETRNEGLMLAQGRYLALMDSDDVSHHDRLLKQYEYLEANNEYVVVGSRIQLIDADGDKLCHMVGIFEHDEIDSAHINNLTSGAIIVNPTAMLRTSSLVAVGGYRQLYKYAEDIDVWLRLAEVGKICNLGEVLLSYRQHFESIGYSYRKGQLEAIEHAITDACIRRGIKNPNIEQPESVTYIKKSEWEVYVKWGWWALNGKNLQTAKKYAIKAIINKPFSIHVWKLLVCSLRGY